MNNIDGALAFRATLDIDQFNVSAQAMERNIKRVSDTAISESEEMEQSILNFAQNGAKYIVSYLVGQGMGTLLQSIISTRGQFQQLEIAFETMLGSSTKARALINQMAETASKTPFDLQGVAGGAKQLLAYGESADKVNDTLVRLGNIASGLSIPLNDIVYLYGTTMVQGRLYAQDVRQFTGRGIPLIKELAAMYGVTADEINGMVSEGKIGFPEVEKVIKKLTDQGGQFYNLMEKQSASLTGKIANLGDAWDMALNKLGTENQDVFANGIEGATYLVEHLDEILSIVKSITVAYGSYRAAIILNTLATKGYTGVSLLDNTARQAKIALMKADAVLTGKSAAQTRAMTAAQEAHTASLQKQLTTEELLNLQKRLRITTIQGLLTAQQQEYLSNLNLTASSANYEAVAMSVLTVEQREALGKVDLSAKSAIYRAALEQEVATKTRNKVATLDAMRADVSAAAAKVESAKQSAVASMQATEAARYELYWAKQEGDVHRIATAEKKLEGAQDNQAVARKAALAAQTDFYTKKKALETAATKQSTVASVADTTAKTTQGTATSLLTAITTRATVAMKALWASMMSNPIGWVVTILGTLVSVLMMFKTTEEEATDAVGEFNKTTKDEINNLDVLFSILANAEKGTKSHKTAIEKINAVCKEYNKTLLDENVTLDLQKVKYKELAQAIQETTAEKIKAKTIEQTLIEQQNANKESLTDLKEEVKDAEYYSHTDVKTGKNIYLPSYAIRKASSAIWEMVESDAMDAAEKLEGLTGEAYTSLFDKLYGEIYKNVQNATHATSEEMHGFEGSLKTYVTEVVNASIKAHKEVKKVDEQLKDYLKEKPTPVVNSVDYVSMSFEDLEKKIKDAQAEIDAINKKKVKVDADNTKLQELTKLIETITGAITTKTNNLNTEAGISARVRELKEERANVEINSEKYKQLSKSIDELEKRLPNRKGGGGSRGNADTSSEDLRKKQLEADRKLEEARISIMEEGYEKRKALLELQHRDNIDQIDEEEKELIEARKKAGKGGLSQSEKDGYAERRRLEEQSYSKEIATLFDGEIDYKKKQYELYFRWVRNMGKEVADARFSDLLKGGNSYKEYIEGEIQKLNEKRNNGEALTDGESNHFIALRMQYEEITGAKSAMDSFKDSVTDAINQASTLAEKIEAIAEAKERLANGTSGLIGDEKNAGVLFVAEEDAKIQKEINDKINNDFKSYYQRKKEIAAEYGAMMNAQQVKYNQELLSAIKQGQQDAISEISVEQITASKEWKTLFGNIGDISIQTMESVRKSLLLIMEDLLKKGELSLENYKTLVKEINNEADSLYKSNPWQSLFGDSEAGGFANFLFGDGDLSEKISSFRTIFSSANSDMSAMAQNSESIASNMGSSANSSAKTLAIVNAIITAVYQTLSAISDTMNTIAEYQDSIGHSEAAEKLGDWANVISTVNDSAMSGWENLKNGNILGAISDVISTPFKLMTELNKIADKTNEKHIQRLQADIDGLKRSYGDLSDIIERSYSTDKAKLIEEQNKNLQKQNELIYEQIRQESDKKDADGNRILEWQNQIAENNKQIAENIKYNIIEAITGASVSSAIDDLANAYADAWSRGEKAAGKSANVVKNIIKTAIIDQLKNKLQPEVEKFMSYLAEALEDGVISEAEEKLLEEYEREMEGISDRYLESGEKWLEDEDAKTDPLEGAVRSMSEETGGVIAGKANAIVINQSEQITIGRAQLTYQAEIAANTRASASELAEIKNTLKRIENNKDSFLLSQGIA